MKSTTDTELEKDRVVRRAAEYVRISTEHEQFSTENQREIIREYARQQGLIIAQTFTDATKSG